MHRVFTSILRRSLVHLQCVSGQHTSLLWNDDLSFRKHTQSQTTLQDSKTRFFPICLCNMNIFMCQLIPASFHKILKNLSFLHMNSSPYMTSNCLARHGRSSLVCLHIREKGFKYCSQQQKLAEQCRTFLFSLKGMNRTCFVGATHNRMFWIQMQIWNAV